MALHEQRSILSVIQTNAAELVHSIQTIQQHLSFGDLSLENLFHNIAPQVFRPKERGIITAASTSPPH